MQIQNVKRKLFVAQYKARTWFRHAVGEFISDESGMGTVEVILIMVVLIGLVIIFKNQINTLIKNILNKIVSQSNTVTG